MGGGGEGQKAPTFHCPQRQSSGRAGAKTVRQGKFARNTQKLPEIISWKKKIRFTYTLYNKSMLFLGVQNRYAVPYTVHNF